ncbi:mannosyl-3-phosphoglycerate phosphatase [Myxosarcina sp. GI1]|uniref:HAD-IIB family hydrolase n=1 Tax=Myxosarcina sp. GI1 TaxID=1541065 RepID=UPI00068BF0DA|nr:HAD-IIB family hydrolase [Myxosarcina sp. GI1]
MRYIVVTDLDGTLLDRQTYEYTPAKTAIAQLNQREIPIIFNSSKTQAEISELRHKLDNREPFVCENGGIICSLEAAPKYLGTPREQFLAYLRSLKQELNLNYQGFADVTIDVVVKWTDLTVADAQKAMQREATEPILWQDSQLALEKFREKLAKRQLQCIKGGRLYHVMGNFNKASCFSELKQYYARRWQEEVKIIALGDSPNDLPMLERADLAVVIPSAKGKALKLERDRVFYASQLAPYGWQEAIDFCLENIL